MENLNKASIVVPTRNRHRCVKVLVDSLMMTKHDFELIVADNSDDSSLKDYFIKYSDDRRLKYSYDSARLSVVDNFNRSLNMATGDYVAFIGDDDMLSANFFDVVQLARKNDADAVIYGKPGRVLLYFWPGVKASFWGDVGGSLYYSKFSGKFFPYSFQAAATEAIAKLGTGPGEMPRAYMGLISRRVINKVKEKHGEVFGGCSPDIYSSHLITAHTSRAFICDYPFIIPGASPASTSAQRAERSDTGALTANDHLGRFANMKWDDRIPRFYAPFTVWAQSHLDALQVTGYSCSRSSFVHLYAKCLIFARGHHKEVLKAVSCHTSALDRNLIYMGLIPKLAQIAVQYLLEKVPALFRQRPGGAHYAIKNCDDIHKAVLQMEDHLKAMNVTLSL